MKTFVILTLFISLLSGTSLAFAKDTFIKKNVCFMTINSSEEKHLFIKHLSSGVNKGKFSFHELVDLNDQSYGWFERQCSKAPPCDILVVSGHFGGAFISDHSSIELPLSELESLSCSNKCSNVLHQPKEVYLFGCNTLATKATDHRTPEEYFQRLLEENFSPSVASINVEGRYGAIGTSFKDSMRRIFKNVPKIYGFDGVAPLGKRIEKSLDRYLKASGNFDQRIDRIEIGQSVKNLAQLNSWNQKNKNWNQYLQAFNKAESTGVMTNCDLLPTPAWTKDFTQLSEICYLKNEEMDLDLRVTRALSLLNSDESLIYIPYAKELFESNFDEGSLQALSQERQLQTSNLPKKLSEAKQLQKTQMGKLKISQLQRSLNFIDENEFNEDVQKTIASYIKYPISVENRDLVCSLKSEFDSFNQIADLNSIDPRLISSDEGLYVLNCLKIKSERILENLLPKIPHGMNFSLMNYLKIYFEDESFNLKTTEALKQKLLALLKSSSLQDKLFAFGVLKNSLSDNEKNNVLKKIIENVNQLKIKNEDVELYALLSDLHYNTYTGFKDANKILQKTGYEVYSLKKMHQNEIFLLIENQPPELKRQIVSQYLEKYCPTNVTSKANELKCQSVIPLSELPLIEKSGVFSSIRRLKVSTQEEENRILNYLESSWRDGKFTFTEFVRSVPAQRLGDAYFKLAVKMGVKDDLLEKFHANLGATK